MALINILLHNININIKLKYHDDGILCSHLAVQICSARTEHRYVLSLQKLINWDGNIVESSERVGWDVERCMENWRGRCSRPNPRQERQRSAERGPHHIQVIFVCCVSRNGINVNVTSTWLQTNLFLIEYALIGGMIIDNKWMSSPKNKKGSDYVSTLSIWGRLYSDN